MVMVGFQGSPYTGYYNKSTQVKLVSYKLGVWVSLRFAPIVSFEASRRAAERFAAWFWESQV